MIPQDSNNIFNFTKQLKKKTHILNLISIRAKSLNNQLTLKVYKLILLNKTQLILLLDEK